MGRVSRHRGFCTQAASSGNEEAAVALSCLPWPFCGLPMLTSPAAAGCRQPQGSETEGGRPWMGMQTSAAMKTMSASTEPTRARAPSCPRRWPAPACTISCSSGGRRPWRAQVRLQIAVLAALLLQGPAGEAAGGHGGRQVRFGTCQMRQTAWMARHGAWGNPFGLPACVSCIGTAKTRITSAHLPAGEAQMAVLPELPLAPGVSRLLQVQRSLLGSSTLDRNLR